MTFLFTDVEGSTRLWAADADAMSASLVVHDEILRSAIESRGGFVFTTAGDSFATAFSHASDAIDAASALQAGLAEADWPGPLLRVRVGVHLGEAKERDVDYFGPAVNTAARAEAAGDHQRVRRSNNETESSDNGVRSGSSVGTNSNNRQPRWELRGRGETHNAPGERTIRALRNHRNAVSIINQAHVAASSSG